MPLFSSLTITAQLSAPDVPHGIPTPEDGVSRTRCQPFHQLIREENQESDDHDNYRRDTNAMRENLAKWRPHRGILESPVANLRQYHKYRYK